MEWKCQVLFQCLSSGWLNMINWLIEFFRCYKSTMTNNEQNLQCMIRALQPMHMFIIGEAGDPLTPLPAQHFQFGSVLSCSKLSPLGLIFRYLPQFKSFSLGWLVAFSNCIYSSPAVPALPKSRDNGRQGLVVEGLLFEKEVQNVSNPSTGKQEIWSMTRMCL